MKKHSIIISRYWHRPKIDVFLMQNGIAIELTVEDFIKSIASEMGTPNVALRQKTLENKLIDAACQVLEKVKETSSST
jgi:hypothetical protein